MKWTVALVCAVLAVLVIVGYLINPKGVYACGIRKEDVKFNGFHTREKNGQAVTDSEKTFFTRDADTAISGKSESTALQCVEGYRFYMEMVPGGGSSYLCGGVTTVPVVVRVYKQEDKTAVPYISIGSSQSYGMTFKSYRLSCEKGGSVGSAASKMEASGGVANKTPQVSVQGFGDEAPKSNIPSPKLDLNLGFGDEPLPKVQSFGDEPLPKVQGLDDLSRGVSPVQGFGEEVPKANTQENIYGYGNPNETRPTQSGERILSGDSVDERLRNSQTSITSGQQQDAQVTDKNAADAEFKRETERGVSRILQSRSTFTEPAPGDVPPPANVPAPTPNPLKDLGRGIGDAARGIGTGIGNAAQGIGNAMFGQNGLFGGNNALGNGIGLGLLQGLAQSMQQQNQQQGGNGNGGGSGGSSAAGATAYQQNFCSINYPGTVLINNQCGCAAAGTAYDRSQQKCVCPLGQVLDSSTNICTVPLKVAASLQCDPAVVDVGQPITLSWQCLNSDYVRGPVDTERSTQTTGSVKIPATFSGTETLKSFTILCNKSVNTAEQAQTAACTVDINRPQLALSITPPEVNAASTSASAVISWQSLGTRSCSVSSPDNSYFNSIATTTGVVSSMTYVRPATTTTVVLMCQTHGNSVRYATSTLLVR
jgi:hypothetical protein